MPILVRGYEVDSQGIVNNAVYLHYMEHTRHQFCREVGFSFRAMQEQGIDPVLAKVEIEYKSPLRLGDEMISCINLSRRGPLFIFNQDIYRADGVLVIKAVASVACLKNGHLCMGNELAEAFKDYL